MNGLSEVLDQLVTNPYVNHNLETNLSSETIDSCGQQLAYEEYSHKALVDRDRALLVNTDTDFVVNAFNALNDNTDNGFDGYYQTWNQLNPNVINDNNVNNESLLLNNDFNHCLNSFDNNFEPNIDLNDNLKQNNRKAVKSSATKKLSRKESNTSVRPPKPVSAYALFFRDAQSVIKSSNPSASFGEISKVVASNWEALDGVNKNIYKQRADREKKNYLKTLASSRAQQVAGLFTDTITKVDINSVPKMSSNTCESVLMDNRLMNETNQQNDNQINSFDTNSDQMSENKASNALKSNTNDNQNFVDKSSQQLQQTIEQSSDPSGSAVPKQHCIREGCSNDAIDSSEWDSEYCSSECCVKHCADVFQAWVQKQQFPQN